MVPSGHWDLAPMLAALRVHHPGWSVSAVWCGDPHLRPVLPNDGGAIGDGVLGGSILGEVVWSDLELAEPAGVGWLRLIAALPMRGYEWCRTAAVVLRLLDSSPEPVIVLRVGSVAVLGDCAALVGDQPVTVVGRVVGQLPNDGLSPSEADVVALGAYSDVVAAFGAGAQPALSWLGRQLSESSMPVGLWLERMAMVFDAGVCLDDGIGVGAWLSAGDADPVLLDLDVLDRDEPWHFTFGATRPRVLLSENLRLAEAVHEGLPQIAGTAAAVRLPGGIVVNTAIRTLTLEALREARVAGAPLPPEPFGAHNSAFLQWLESPYTGGTDLGRYWLELRRQRADLQAMFVQPESVDATRYAEWTMRSWGIEHHSMLIGPSSAAPQPIVSIGFDETGVNVLGYLDFDQSLGHIAREIVAALDAAHVPVSALNHTRTRAPRRSSPTHFAREARYAANIVVVTADQFEFVVADHARTLLDGRYTIAYWFWELEFVPSSMRTAIDHVDEIWTGSQFVARAFACVTDKPVRCVPLPVPEPRPSARDRASFGIAADRFVFLTTFDSASVPERKNPFGVIDAFTRAFRDGEGPLLWMKTMNGEKGWSEHERLLVAAAGRSDIIVWDQHLHMADQMAVLRAADCLVSLHRSEGLGLPCAEAMWLGKPVIATRYSGNLDFMDDSCAAMIDYQLVAVRHGQGIYPSEAVWAEPDVEQAADWMRRLAADPTLCADLGSAARSRMLEQPSLEDTGRTMASAAHHGLARQIRGGARSWD